MSRKTLSLIIRCSYDPQADNTHMRIEHIETGDVVHILDNSFLIRCSFNGHVSVQRCLIRHIASGREAYVQVGPGLRDFIKTCLLDISESSGHA